MIEEWTYELVLDGDERYLRYESQASHMVAQWSVPFAHEETYVGVQQK
jgi:hypothetical protein